MAAIKALEQWCKMQCDGYRDVAITNMTTSFKNGLAFCALIHKYRPDLIDYDSLSKEDVFENNHLAFRVAEEKLGIPALLDAEDMVALRIPDRLSILTYVSQYHNYFKGRSPMGGVKRPAEGSKEEPSEKKNLPVVAKTFVSKTAIENCLPAALIAETSLKLARAAVQKTVLSENANKTGTLNSKCVACKSHVHLVQRHFVDGKLFHRSCFKCSECSALLHAGAYKAGKEPDTLLCKTHSAHNGCKPSTSGAVVKNGLSSSVLQPKVGSQTQPVSRPSSVLTTPVNVASKPVDAAPTTHSWTASAQKTQAARQRFFQAAPPATQLPTSHRKPPGPPNVSDGPKGPLSPEEKSSGRPTKLAEENCNNNNACRFVIRSAKRRFEDNFGMSHNKGSPGPAENQAGQPFTRHNDNIMEPRCSKAITDSRRPTPVYTNAKDPVHHDWRSNLKPVKKDPGLRSPEAGPASVEQRKPELTLQLPSNISFTTTKSPSVPTPKVSPVTPQCKPVWYIKPPHKPDPGPGNCSLNHMSSSPIPPIATIAVAGPTKTNPTIGGDPWTSCYSGSKRGKYLSSTNASMPEMRSPPIVKELHDIETRMSILEKEGVELETKLRICETEGEGDILMDPLMVDWFNLIRKKQMYIRKESELIYIARTQDLEQQQPGVEGELRRLLEKPDHLKSNVEQCREQRLLDRLVEIVNRRNAIVEGLDEDRLREVEEDQQLNKMMQNLGVKQSKNTRKSSISKLFRRRSKKEVK